MIGMSIRAFLDRQRSEYLRDPAHHSAVITESGATWLNEMEFFDPPQDAKDRAKAQLRFVAIKLAKEGRDFANFKHALENCLLTGRTVPHDWAHQLLAGKARIEDLQRRQTELEEAAGFAEERRLKEEAAEQRRQAQAEFERQHNERRDELVAAVRSITIDNVSTIAH